MNALSQTHIRGLPGCDGAGVSLNAAPTPFFESGANVGRVPWWACTYGKGFRVPSSAAFLGGGGLFRSVLDSVGSADAGRGDSPSRFAFSTAASLLMSTFWAKRECWLVRRVGGVVVAERRRGCVCGAAAAMMEMGKAGMFDEALGAS